MWSDGVGRVGAALLCTCCLLAASQRPTGPNKRHDLYIAGFFPYGRHVPESHIGRGVMPAVKLALDHINDNPTVLRNYRLHMWWNDTQSVARGQVDGEELTGCLI
uniref:Receptor ligand binding region domain-containing protein n=1 Tax=Rhodnius prolixus TaxID=13249 RepID=T1HBX7_RHOPR